MFLQFTAAYFSATGLRHHNEDSVGMVIPSEPQLSDRGMIAAIADGVSGSADGHQAAEYTLRELLADYYEIPDCREVTRSLDEAIKAINLRVIRLGSLHTEIAGMATTLTTLVIRGNYYYFAHIGDTRLYRLRGDDLDLLTSDHVADQADKKHLLTRAIGLHSNLIIDHGTGEINHGDIFLLATDGVWSVLPEHELSWHLAELIDDKRSAEGTAKLLVDAALAAGSNDNLSALVVRIDQMPPP